MEKPFAESWFYAPINAVADRAELSPEETFHMRKVLRIQPPRQVVVSNGLGSVHLCDTASTKGDGLELIAVECIKQDLTPPRATMVLGLLKGKDLEEPVEGLCQLNIRAIHLVTTDHSQEFKGQNFEKLVDRLRLKSLVGLKQAKKAWLTEIHGPVPLPYWLKQTSKNPVILLHPGPDNLPQNLNTEYALLVGPEGGFSEGELAEMKNSGDLRIGLGATRLRAVHAPLLAFGKLMGLGLA